MRYLTSDLHFQHKNVIRYCNRPFTKNLDELHNAMLGSQTPDEVAAAIEKDVLEMNEAIISNWNSIVMPQDEVVVVGDFSLSFKAVELYTNRLNGRKILVAGNHDFCHPAHHKSKHLENQKKWIDKYLENGWAEVHMELELDLPGIGLVNVSHLPYKGCGDSMEEERHEKHRLEDDGRWLICGHVHCSWKTHKKQLNVGVDVWGYKPVSEEEVIRTILNFK